MLFYKTKPELISYRQLRMLVGLIGFSLPVILITGNCIAEESLVLKSSISHYYYSCMGDIFVGLLCAVAIFLFTYKGHAKEEKDFISDSFAGNTACIFALGIAFFPTAETNAAQNPVSWVHYICAGLFFSSLAYFSLIQFTKTKGEISGMKLIRNKVYKICGWTIVVSIAMLLLYNIPVIKRAVTNTPYFIGFEIVALWAFAFSWLVKAEVFLADKETVTEELI